MFAQLLCCKQEPLTQSSPVPPGLFSTGSICPCLYIHPRVQRLWATPGQGKLGNCRVNRVTVHFTVQAEKPRSLALCGPLDILGLETGTVPLASEAGEAGRLRQVPKIGQSWDSPQ